MAIALVSDIHSNIEAMEAVLRDIESQGVKRIFCLGDLIDYGPNPREILDIAIEKFEVNILGNHEEAVMMVAEDFNDRAMQSVHWTREQLNDTEIPRDKRRAYWNFLDKMAKTKAVKMNEHFFVHGTPRQTQRDYIFPKDVKTPEKIDQIFESLQGEQRYCFCGHSHIPGIYTDKYQYAHPQRMRSGRVDLKTFDRLLINIGSVGQPRDLDPRASYVILDGFEVHFRRVDYDFNKTVEKLREIKELPPFLAERLLVGK